MIKRWKFNNINDYHEAWKSLMKLQVEVFEYINDEGSWLLEIDTDKLFESELVLQNMERFDV